MTPVKLICSCCYTKQEQPFDIDDACPLCGKPLIELLTPIKAIRKYCVNNCCSGSTTEVRKCNAIHCEYFIYRMGNNPSRRGIGGNPKIKELNNER